MQYTNMEVIKNSKGVFKGLRFVIWDICTLGKLVHRKMPPGKKCLLFGKTTRKIKIQWEKNPKAARQHCKLYWM